MSALRATRLSPEPGGRIRVLELREDVAPDQLAKLRAHRAELAPIVAAFGACEILIRPVTIAVEPEPVPVFAGPLPPRRRSTKPPARPAVVRPNPLACIHCNEPCPPADLAESIPLGDGRWEHLSCWLAATNPRREAS